jgi:hypothetical protein
LPSNIDYERKPNEYFVANIEEVPLPPPDDARGVDRNGHNSELPQHNQYLPPLGEHYLQQQPQQIPYQQQLPHHNNYQPQPQIQETYIAPQNHPQYQVAHPELLQKQITLAAPEQVTFYPKHPSPYEDHINLPKIEFEDIPVVHHQQYPSERPLNYNDYKKPDLYLQDIKEISLHIPVEQVSGIDL